MCYWGSPLVDVFQWSTYPGVSASGPVTYLTVDGLITKLLKRPEGIWLHAEMDTICLEFRIANHPAFSETPSNSKLLQMDIFRP